MSVKICVGLVLIATFICLGDGIQCFHCTTAISEYGEDPCLDAPLKTCPPESNRCMSAKFRVSTSDKLTSLMKDSLQQNSEGILKVLDCIPDLYGQECEMFLKLMEGFSPYIKFNYHEKCKICSTDGCNSAPAKKLSTLLFAAAFFISFANLFRFYGANN